MNWDELFTVFTELAPAIRKPVLKAIADPNRKIVSHAWSKEGGDCIELAAAKAVQPGFVFNCQTDRQRCRAIGKVLHIGTRTVADSVKLWDQGSDQDRENFRERIRNFLEVENGLDGLADKTHTAIPSDVPELVGTLCLLGIGLSMVAYCLFV